MKRVADANSIARRTMRHVGDVADDRPRVPQRRICTGQRAWPRWCSEWPCEGLRPRFRDDCDGMLWWLSNRSQAAANFAKHYLLTHAAVAYNIHGKRVTVSASGLTKVYAGAASAAYFGVPNSDPRHPVIFGIGRYGVVYADAPDIAQHGGAVFQDFSIPILVVLPGLH